MPHVLAIDQSTSATKALVFSEQGDLLAKEAQSHRQIYPQPGWVEHDAEEIWSNTLEVVDRIARNHPELAAELGWLSISNQRETIVVFDRETGQPLYNAIVWQCRRGDPLCAELKQSGHEPTVAAATGLKVDTYFPASKLRWLVENKPEIAARLSAGTALIGTIDAYLIYRLTGGRVFASDHTNACRTLLYNIYALAWDEQLCQLFRVPVEALPEVRSSAAQFGETDAAGRLPGKLPICGVMGDSQASLFALGCHRSGDTKATFGTGSSLLTNTGSQALAPSGGSVATIAWVLGDQPTYCLEGVVNYSAATIEWLKNQLGLIDDAAETDALARSVADNGGVYLVPAFAGLGAPYWSADARAAIVGMSSHSTKAHIVRAALESIAYQIRDVLGMMKEASGVSLARIRADGGATSNEFLMQFTSDIVAVELETTQVAEASPLGAALCGALGQGVYATTEEIRRLAPEKHAYRPVMDRQQADRLYCGWTAAVKRVL